MTWDEPPEPEVEDRNYTVRCTVELTIKVTAPDKATETQLADLVEEYLESDSAIYDPAVQGTVDIEDVN